MRALFVALILCSGPALAESDLSRDPPPPARPSNDASITAEAFERFVEGRTMDTHDQTGRYGVETFLPGRRAMLKPSFPVAARSGAMPTDALKAVGDRKAR